MRRPWNKLPVEAQIKEIVQDITENDVNIGKIAA
jgi:hypothetical protein